ncbi:GAF domain-containing sensor histidine kinase [Pedobacter glucosidilyticus]|uniref:GAF domain-containing sensor histidine kinase n=1 Tax=Pedobacter glucosidilyticus TaxID=1122941 RepID=UPI0026EF73D5|nr:GAF domain-containing sensor histidine kinase [Pedobacter glucosidilyticus]
MATTNSLEEERMNEIYKITSLLIQTNIHDFTEILNISCGFLQMETGIISQVIQEDYHIIDFDSNNKELQLKNQVFDLKDTFCEITIRENNVFDVDDAANSHLKGHPCYSKFQTRSYIGVPIISEGKKFGTLNFSSSYANPKKFNQADRDFVQYLGQWISNYLDKRSFEKQIAEKNEELLKLNQELEKNNENLQKIMQEKDQLSQILLHDLKSPLSNIKMLSFLFEEMVTNSETEELFGIFNKSMQDVFHLISQMETLNSMESTPIKPYIEELELNAFVKDIIGNFLKSADEKNISLNYEPLPTALNIKTDSNLLTRVLNNLFSNAIKFSSFNKQVFITLQTQDDQFSVSIKDEGPGIHPHEMDKLFKRFTLLSNKPTNNESSSGLGLYIVKELLEKLKGSIDVMSTPGQGSLFKVNLPLTLVAN